MSNQAPMSLSGTVASSGIAIGRAVVMESELPSINRDQIKPAQVKDEVVRFHKARKLSLEQLNELYEKAKDTLGESEADVFGGHAMLLDDEELEEEVLGIIQDQLYSADFAVDTVMSNNIVALSQIEDEYLRARAADMDDLRKRLIRNLFSKPGETQTQAGLVASEGEPIIIFADDLSPAETLSLDLTIVSGFVTATGGGMSHTAILARSMGLPAIVGVNSLFDKVTSGNLAVLDGDNNAILINPEKAILCDCEARRATQVEKQKALKELKDLPAQTTDGHRVELAANIGTDNEVEGVLENGAEAIGLYRSEFLFMGQKSAPSEEIQFNAYRAVLEKMEGKPVILRTLDVGGDKHIPYLKLEEELNPFLGKRAIRLCFDDSKLFNAQLRAALRASAFGQLRLMFPMVISVEEVRKLHGIIEELKQDLRSENIAFDENIKIGAMVETPASVMIARDLIEELDFFSIGTNDLTQYILAVDRCNTEIAHLYNPLTPAVLKAIKQVIDATHDAGKWVGICGELAATENAALLLVGMGLDELSMSASAIPRVKSAIRNCSQTQLTELAERVLSLKTAVEISEALASITE